MKTLMYILATMMVLAVSGCLCWPGGPGGGGGPRGGGGQQHEMQR